MQTASGSSYYTVPLPMAYIADLVEGAAVSGIRCYPAEYPDLNFLVPKAELNSVHGVFERRTEEHHDQAGRADSRTQTRYLPVSVSQSPEAPVDFR